MLAHLKNTLMKQIYFNEENTLERWSKSGNNSSTGHLALATPLLHLDEAVLSQPLHNTWTKQIQQIHFGESNTPNTILWIKYTLSKQIKEIHFSGSNTLGWSCPAAPPPPQQKHRCRQRGLSSRSSWRRRRRRRRRNEGYCIGIKGTWTAPNMWMKHLAAE